MKQGVLVLMSTYNGEKYLHEQIDSIFLQKGVNVDLIVRDDGSTDRTLEILDEYKSLGKLSYYTGENIGPQRSFMHLLQNAPEYEYYAFADQDDYWMDDKLLCAISLLTEKVNTPSLYFSQTKLVDEKLNPMKSVTINPLLTFGEALIYKFVGGCTMVFNHKLRVCISDKLPSQLPMHDIWIYTFAIAIDAFIYFDRIPHILYRQHGNNTVGQGQGFLYEWRKRCKRFLSKGGIRYIQARELYSCYKDIIPEKNLRILKMFLAGKNSFFVRSKMLFDKNFKCADNTTRILFFFNLLFNKY